jgi:hypothetical protein
MQPSNSLIVNGEKVSLRTDGDHGWQSGSYSAVERWTRWDGTCGI